MSKQISYVDMIKSKTLDSFEKLCLCPNCSANIMPDDVSDELSTVAVCPMCDLKIYVGDVL